MKVFFLSLGCDKNKVDSEKILEKLFNFCDVEIVDDLENVDVAIVNTCSFIRDAKLESIEWIEYLTKLKRKHKIKKIMVTGCLATEYKKYNDKVANYDKLFKDVDIVLPLDNYIDDLHKEVNRVTSITSFSSNLKISDGCDKFCSYCIIPYLRGRYRDIDRDVIIKEAENLAKRGVKELNIVGQDILKYNGFTKLINDISKIDGIEWIRLLYCYPEEVDENVVNLIATNKKVLHYIDMPIQHASDKLLKLMNRKTSRLDIEKKILMLRSSVKDIVIRTTLIVGFPGETTEDFAELKDFVKEMRFDKLGVFTYSREKLSKSYDFENQVTDDIKEKRRKEIFDIQKSIVIENNANKINNVYRAIVEGYDTNKKMYVVRPYFNARGIDDNVYVKTKENLMSGIFVNAKIEKVCGYDLIATIV